MKIGDKVRIKEGADAGVLKIGDCGIITAYLPNENITFNIEVERADGKSDLFSESELEPFVKTLENLQEGDEVVKDGGYKRTVLGILGKLYGMSGINDADRFDRFFTNKELERFGYKPVQNDEETVDYEGKTYLKKDFEERLKALKPIK